MERYAWKATVLPGKLEEYIYRHDNIWPEMKQVLSDAGIRNYTIWNVGNELFGYYECEHGIAYAEKAQAAPAIIQPAPEEFPEVTPAPAPEPAPAQWVRFEALLTTAQAYGLKKFFDENGIHFRPC